MECQVQVKSAFWLIWIKDWDWKNHYTKENTASFSSLLTPPPTIITSNTYINTIVTATIRKLLLSHIIINQTYHTGPVLCQTISTNVFVLIVRMLAPLMSLDHFSLNGFCVDILKIAMQHLQTVNWCKWSMQIFEMSTTELGGTSNTTTKFSLNKSLVFMNILSQNKNSGWKPLPAQLMNTNLINEILCFLLFSLSATNFNY